MKITEKIAKESNHDYALRTIKDNIINLQLEPGTMVSEQDIANELKLSRTPVHESFQELAKTQIVEIMPQKGILISYIDMKLVDEARFIRSRIESSITEEACKIATDKDIVDLEEILNLHEFYFQKNNIEKLWEMDNAFHEKVYKITNKMLCYYTVKLMNIHYDRFRNLRLHAFDSSSIMKEHKEILQAFKERDSESVQVQILRHLNHIYIDEQEIRLKYQDYFKN